MSQTRYIYCPHCATELSEKTAFNQARSVCPQCDFIHFQDPKVAVIALVTSGEHVLLIQRGVDPERGKWALPGGYMDAGEMPESALRRELLEEVAIEVEVRELRAIFPMAGAGVSNAGIVLAYHATPLAGGLPTLARLDDVSDARWYTADDLPPDLAFDSTIQMLEAWMERQNPADNAENLEGTVIHG